MATTITFTPEKAEAANRGNLASLPEWLVLCDTGAGILGFGLQWWFLSLFLGFIFFSGAENQTPGFGHTRWALTSPLNWIPVYEVGSDRGTGTLKAQAYSPCSSRSPGLLTMLFLLGGSKVDPFACVLTILLGSSYICWVLDLPYFVVSLPGSFNFIIMQTYACLNDIPTHSFSWKVQTKSIFFFF